MKVRTRQKEDQAIDDERKRVKRVEFHQANDREETERLETGSNRQHKVTK